MTLEIELKEKETLDAINKKMAELIPEVFMQRMKIHSHYEDITITPLEDRPDGPRVFKNWMSIILVSGQTARLTIKVHFDQVDAKNFASKAFDMSAEELESKLSTDFMKEYCNLSAGLFKKLFEEVQLFVGISLPFYTRGFYEVFFDQQEKKYSHIEYYKMKFHDHDLVMSTNLEIFNLQDAMKILDIKLEAGEAAQEEEIDFL